MDPVPDIPETVEVHTIYNKLLTAKEKQALWPESECSSSDSEHEDSGDDSSGLDSDSSDSDSDE